MVVDPKIEFIDCNPNVCFQKFRKEQTFESDKMRLYESVDKYENLKMSEVEFYYIDKKDKEGCQKLKKFIERYEWLGNIPNRPTHRFAITYKGEVLAVLIMATPNAFSHLLGKANINLEKLIARGASMSLAPTNIGNFLIMKAVKWMVENTEFRYFTCYSDPEAKELGTIYQACNFIYLGCNFGAGKMYIDPS